MTDRKFSVFVVDDEQPARRKIELLLDQIDSPFSYSGSARNGREALDAYRQSKPDLLLVDIQMPVMDGLEFIREIRKIDASQAVIIVSCHESFSYAKEAVKLGVIDYLIKDLLTRDELYTVLMKAENILDIRLSEINKQSDLPVSEDSQPQNRKNRKRHSSELLKLITGNRENCNTCSMDSERLNNSEAVFHKPPYAAICLSIDDFRNISADRVNVIDLIDNIIYSVLQENSWGESAYCQTGIYAAAVSLSEFADEDDIIKNCSHILNCIRSELEKKTDITVSAGVSALFYSIDELPDNYTRAYELLKYRIFLGGGRTIFSTVQIAKIPSLKTEKIEICLEKIKKLASEKRFQKVVSSIRELYNTELEGILQYNYIQHIHANLFSVIIDICKNNKISYDEIFGKSYLPVDIPENFNTIDESKEWFTGVFDRIIEIRNSGRECWSSHINKAVSLIVENPKITLQELSDRLFINKSYLSRLFKKETGCTVLEYTLKVRIDKAKNLLNDPSARVNEVAEKLGYEYTQQFTSDFKKFTGISPTEYRSEIF